MPSADAVGSSEPGAAPAGNGMIGPVPDVDALFSAVIDVLPSCVRGEAVPSTPSGAPGSSVRCVVEGTPDEELLFVVSDDVERELAATQRIAVACDGRVVVQGDTWLIAGLREPDVPAVVERSGGVAAPLDCLDG